MQSAPLLCVQTWVLAAGGYSIELAPDPEAPRLILLTDDPQLHARALAIEGHPIRTVATFHREGYRPRGGAINILDALEVIP